LLTKHGAGQTNLRLVPPYSAFSRLLEAQVMDLRFFGKNKLAMAVMATTVAIVLWGFGVEFVLHNYVFISPPEKGARRYQILDDDRAMDRLELDTLARVKMPG
jgi:hypothetical protein